MLLLLAFPDSLGLLKILFSDLMLATRLPHSSSLGIAQDDYPGNQAPQGFPSVHILLYSPFSNYFVLLLQVVMEVDQRTLEPLGE